MYTVAAVGTPCTSGTLDIVGDLAGYSWAGSMDSAFDCGLRRKDRSSIRNFDR